MLRVKIDGVMHRLGQALALALLVGAGLLIPSDPALAQEAGDYISQGGFALDSNNEVPYGIAWDGNYLRVVGFG